MMKENSLSEKAYRIMKENLINYEKGQYLSARAFAEKIGMSYTPVRDAFIRLQREGFIEKIPNVGFFVVRLDIRDIIEIFQVRECIEPFVFETVFDTINDNHIDTLVKLTEKQKKALINSDIKQYVKIDEQFHQVFFDIYGNHHFSNLIKNVREQYLFCSRKVAKTNSHDGIDEHEQFIQQIKEKNKDKAICLYKAHIENAKKRMEEGFISGFEI